MKFLPRICCHALLLTWISVTGLVAQQSPAKAAAHRSRPATPAQRSNANPAFAPPSANSNRELIHASNEADGRTAGEAGVGNAGDKDSEDQEAAFKHSRSVQKIAQWTHLPVEPVYWICVALNFAAVIVGLWWLLTFFDISGALRGRTGTIQKGMEEARRASEEARRHLQEIETRLSRMNIDITEMQKHAEHESKAEEVRLRASIEEEKHKIVESAQHEVEQATSAARRELQKYAVGLAIAMAEKGIRVDVEEDKQLVEDFSEQLTSETRRNGGS